MNKATCFPGSTKTYVPNPWVKENSFRDATHSPSLDRPAWESVRLGFPQILWESARGEQVAKTSEAVWKMAWGNIRPATAENGFLRDYADTAFNGCLFLWDSVFITMFWRYGRRVWDATGTLDNLYAKQHPDGFISRQISGSDGLDQFPRHDPSATGPDVAAWAEWEHFLATGDKDRLSQVFPALAGFTRWMRRNRTWPDGSYWASGWASGMDDQPRRPDAFLTKPPEGIDGFHSNFDHGHMSWVDACFQALLANRMLVRIADTLGIGDRAVEFREEAARLAKWCSRHLWDSQTRFFHDRMRDGSLARHLKSIGAYWALLAGGVGPRRLRGFLAHLSDEGAFNRPHRVPSLSADSTGYREDGGYWCGAVWSPTTAMIVRGLELAGHPDPAHAIALNHLDNVVDCHAETGTFFECYGPEKHAAGIHRRDFVGWTGLAPTSLLMEHVFGLRPNAVANRLVWNIRLTDGHGVQKYPFGADGEMDLYCPPRRSMDETPRPIIRSTRPVEIEIRWRSGRLKLTAGDQ
jgi:hypothetical protein